MRFEYATRGMQGQREEQEDAVGLWDHDQSPLFDCALDGSAPALVIALADGMGGQAAGGVASRIACMTFMEVLGSTGGDISARMQDALREANEAIAHAVDVDATLKTMGCTLVGLALDNNDLEWVSLGDTHLFLLRKGKLLLLNADQSGKPVLEKLVAAGRVSAEDARDDKANNILYAALTGGKTGSVDRSWWPFELAGDDILVAVTDGIDTLQHDEIAKACVGGALDPGKIAERLLAAVEAAGDAEQDNTTVCVVRVVDVGETQAA